MSYKSLPLLPALVLLVCGCGPGTGTHKTIDPGEAGEREKVAVPAVRFTDVTDKAGIRFVHTNGSFGKKLLPETMGSGVAFLDFNKDGKQDILFVNSCFWPGHEEAGRRPTLALYRNDSKDGEIQFTDVTADVGLDVTMFGMGVAVGDYDNDGWPDVFVTGVGGNRLFKNVGGKRFEDVTAKARVGGPGGWPSGGDFLRWDKPVNWSTSAAWLDYDGDGRLDLFVCNYITWSPDYDLKLESSLTGRDRAFGPPVAFPGSHCFLYRNKGDGTFEDVSRKAGVEVYELMAEGDAARPRPIGKSLGVAVADVDGDGHPDIIVANDTVRNFFFHNNGDGTFTEMGLSCGVALADGRARGAMGLDIGEYRPGKYAVVIANFADEPTTLLRLNNPRRLSFDEGALSEGLAGPSRPLLKFGVFFFDYDLDGRLDLLTANGHLEPEIGKVQPGQRYRQPAQLFWNTGGKQRFEPVPKDAAGPDLFREIVGRGSAFADIDGDGYPDVVLMNNGGPAKLLHNEGGTGHHWVRLVLEGDGLHSNRSAIGARVTLEAGGVTQHREVTGARGYLSQSELPVTFGLGDATKVDRVTIRWPGKDGGETVLTDVDIDT
ncbi:MAG TPA: CRTAC1 family protein, partial [Gemmataceae bacterium]|nr:CRTAC1 family protein [Gemmataceae bacterium]